MLVKESLFEFERGQDPYKNMDIGTRQKIQSELEDLDIDPKNIKIDSDFTINIVSAPRWRDDDILAIQKKYYNEAQNEFLSKIQDKGKLSTNLAIDKALEDGLSLKNIKNTIEAWGHPDIQKKAEIYLAKLGRTEKDKQFDDENNIYVFIGFNDKKPVTINGKKYYEDKFGTESIIKLDKFNPAELMQIPMMKMRAQTQYPDGAVYMIHIPKDWMDEDRYGELPEDYYQIILDHMKKI
jgi:hypothetical protein